MEVPRHHQTLAGSSGVVPRMKKRNTGASSVSAAIDGGGAGLAVVEKNKRV